PATAAPVRPASKLRLKTFSSSIQPIRRPMHSRCFGVDHVSSLLEVGMRKHFVLLILFVIVGSIGIAQTPPQPLKIYVIDVAGGPSRKATRRRRCIATTSRFETRRVICR